MRIPYISLIAAGALTLGGCAYGDLGYGLGYGDPYYGYGYNNYGPYGGYGAYPGYYGGFGYGGPYMGYGGYSPFGWYDNYYYPGSGIYVYDSSRRSRVWSDQQRAYWMARRQAMTNKSGTSQTVVTTSPNWSGFATRSSMSTADRQAAQQARMQAREERIQAREERRRNRDQTQP